MPELPEVETIKNDLRALVVGRRITGVEVPDPQIGRHIDLSRFIPGLVLGNIYADEVLFAARIAPTRKASDLAPEEVERLYEAMREILREALSLRGTTVQAYRDVLGRKGSYQSRLKVFRKAGKPCEGCPGVVVQTRVGGRDTFFCPSCQR
jgi:DNA-formamidopyrimidine glycosylase